MKKGAEFERGSRIWKREQTLKKGAEFERGSRIGKGEPTGKPETAWTEELKRQKKKFPFSLRNPSVSVRMFIVYS